MPRRADPPRQHPARRRSGAGRSGPRLPARTHPHARSRHPGARRRGRSRGARRGRSADPWRLNSHTRSDLARPSMGQDMLKGRRTEIDFINGVIAERGRAIGRPPRPTGRSSPPSSGSSTARCRPGRRTSTRSEGSPVRRACAGKPSGFAPSRLACPAARCGWRSSSARSST